jgi:plasmid maintenance system antidote protein VapI
MSAMANDALKAGVKKVQNAFADQANAMLKKGVPFQVILTALANITLEMAMKIEKSGDSAAALKRLQDHLAQIYAEHTKTVIRRHNTIN